MKKLVSAAAASVLLAGAVSAETTVKFNANGRYGTNLWTGIAAEKGIEDDVEDDSYWNDGIKESWTDEVKMTVTSDNAGVMINENISSESISMNKYDVWLKYGDLRLDFGKMDNRAGIIGDNNGNWFGACTILAKPGINNGVLSAYKNRGYVIGVNSSDAYIAATAAAKKAYDAAKKNYGSSVVTYKEDGSGTKSTIYYDENGNEVTSAEYTALANAAAEEAGTKAFYEYTDSSLAKYGTDSTSYTTSYSGTKENALWLTYALGDFTFHSTMFTNGSKTFTDFNLAAEYKKDALDAALTLKFTDSLSGLDEDTERYAQGTDMLAALSCKYDINEQFSVFGAYTLGLPYLGKEFTVAYTNDDGVDVEEEYAGMTPIHAIDLRAQFKQDKIFALLATNFTMITPSKYTKELSDDAEAVMGIDVGAQFQYTISDLATFDFQTRYDCYDLMKKNDEAGLNSMVIRPGVILSAQKNCTVSTGVEVTLDNMFTSTKKDNSDEGMLVLTTKIPLVVRVKL